MKNLITSIGFIILQRAAISVSHFNKDVKSELEAWNEGFRVKLQVSDSPLAIAWIKKDGALKYLPVDSKDFDLIVQFRTLDTAFRIITTLSNVPQAFTQNRIQAFGHIPNSMILIRILNTVQAYLFPPFLSKRVLKRVPNFNFSQHIGRLRVYTTGLLFAW